MSRKIMLAAASCAAVVGLTAAAQAAPKIGVVELPATRFERSIEAHRELERYRETLAKARKLEVAPKNDLIADSGADVAELTKATRVLRERIENAEPEYGLAGGVSQATLDAIAACESGGDPTAVNAAGYYGKYQFDTGTWAAVGGTGNPAAASEAEQDYRASLLYARAGSSPWPVCGV